MSLSLLLFSLFTPAQVFLKGIDETTQMVALFLHPLQFSPHLFHVGPALVYLCLQELELAMLSVSVESHLLLLKEYGVIELLHLSEHVFKEMFEGRREGGTNRERLEWLAGAHLTGRAILGEVAFLAEDMAAVGDDEGGSAVLRRPHGAPVAVDPTHSGFLYISLSQFGGFLIYLIQNGSPESRPVREKCEMRSLD